MKPLAYVVMAAGLLAACSNSNSDQAAAGGGASVASAQPSAAGTTITPDQANPAAPQPVAMDVRDAQIKLRAQGYHPGAIDRIFGPRTSRAVLAYQRHNGLGTTASLDAATIASLNGGAATANNTANNTGGLQQPIAMAGDAVRDAQSRLRAQGYYHGPIDGLSGPRTRQAVIAYQRHNGMPVTATLDGDTLARLDGGATSSYGASGATAPAAGGR